MFVVDKIKPIKYDNLSFQASPRRLISLQICYHQIIFLTKFFLGNKLLRSSNHPSQKENRFIFFLIHIERAINMST